MRSTAARLPLVLMLQGVLVDKAEYSNYAQIIARYGFVVVVLNHERNRVVENSQQTGTIVLVCSVE